MNKKSEKSILGLSYLLNTIGDYDRGNWNYIFDDPQILCERLGQLKIEKIMETAAVEM